MNIDKSLYVPTVTQNPTANLDVRRILPVVKVGAILDVLVSHQHNRKNYTLQLGRETLQASSDRQLPVGSRQILRVLSVDLQGRVTTEVLSPTENRVAQALASRAASAQSLSQVFQVLPRAQLPQSAQAPAASLLAATATRSEIVQPEKIAQAIRNSGVFLEAALARGDPMQGRDLKSLLLTLLNQLASRAPEKSTAPLPQSYAPSRPGVATLPPPPGQNAAGKLQLPLSDLPAVPAKPSTSQTAPTNSPLPRPTLGPPLPGLTSTSAPTRSELAPQAAPPPSPASSERPAYLQQQADRAYQQMSQQASSQQGVLSAKPGARSPQQAIESPQSVQRALESGLARLESHQLTAVQARENQQLMWLLELPVRNGSELDVWQFFLRREEQPSRHRPDTREAHWRVSLSVELGQLGELAIEVDYSASETCLAFYSKTPEVLALIQQRQHSFSAHLNSLGLDQAQIQIHFGELPESAHPPYYQPGLDARA